jgi:hypothetical protein
MGTALLPASVSPKKKKILSARDEVRTDDLKLVYSDLQAVGIVRIRNAYALNVGGESVRADDV